MREEEDCLHRWAPRSRTSAPAPRRLQSSRPQNPPLPTPQSGEALTKLAAGSPSLLVMDLRNNGGGVFAQGVAVAQQLLAEGTEVVLIADRCVHVGVDVFCKGKGFCSPGQTALLDYQSLHHGEGGRGGVGAALRLQCWTPAH